MRPSRCSNKFYWSAYTGWHDQGLRRGGYSQSAGESTIFRVLTLIYAMQCVGNPKYDRLAEGGACGDSLTVEWSPVNGGTSLLPLKLASRLNAKATSKSFSHLRPFVPQSTRLRTTRRRSCLRPGYADSQAET